MYAIARHKNGAALGVATGPIPNHQNIKRWWTATLPPHLLQSVMNTFGDLRTRDLWLACACTNDRKNPPLLAPMQTPSGSVSIRRMKDRAPHTTECVFAFEQREEVLIDQDPTARGDNEKPAKPPQFLEQGSPTRLAKSPNREQKEGDEGRKRRSKDIDPLARQMLWLLDQSGLQQWPTHGETSAQMILAVAEGLAVKNDLHLDDILYCNSRAWTEAWMGKSFDACERAGLEAQAILICPVQSASRAESWIKFKSDGETVAVNGHISIWGEADAQARYPMLMYAKVTRKPGEVPRIIKAHLHPVLSTDQWMLVDSDYERKAFHTIQHACRVLEQKGIGCHVEKPVYDWQDTGARPDFVVTGEMAGNSHTLIVETMGTADPEYTTRKKVTVGKLAGYTVFEDKRYLNDDEVDHRLFRYTLGFMQSRLHAGDQPE